MASQSSTGAISTREGVDAVGDAFQLVAQGLAQLQEALRLQKQEAEREVQEALCLQKQEAERKVQEALSQQEEAEHRTQEALRLQEQRAATALREMERKLQEKDEAIRALQQRLEETQERVTAVEERTTAPEGSGSEGCIHRLEGRMNEVEASLLRALQTFMPRVEAVLNQLEEPQSPHASPATDASAREALAMGGTAAGGGEEPLSSTPTRTSSGATHQDAAADEEERARQRVKLRVREVKLKMEEVRTSPFALGKQLCKAAGEGRISDIRSLIASGADVNYITESGYTPLNNASWKAHADVVSLLLQRGADANAVDGSGHSALHWASCKDESRRCVELLLREGADVDARDINGETPLHWAAIYNNEKAVRALLAAGARTDLKSWSGVSKNKTPFDFATSSNIQDLLRL